MFPLNVAARLPFPSFIRTRVWYKVGDCEVSQFYRGAMKCALAEILRDMQIIKESYHETRVLISDPDLFWIRLFSLCTNF
jgi:hypothetical protein